MKAMLAPAAAAAAAATTTAVVDCSAATATPRRRNDSNKEVSDFFAFVCLSTAFRSFEAGIISSMMPAIRHQLDLTYTQEGLIAASPDYGIVPGSILAIFVFQSSRLRQEDAKRLLTVVMFGTAAACVYCAVYPSLRALVVARAVGGLLWAPAATHYPVWIHYRGPEPLRTIWLAGTNVSLLAGVLAGYVAGGIARTCTTVLPYGGGEITITWMDLYFLEGLLMMACGVILVFCFPPGVVDHRKQQQAQQQHQQQQHEAEEANGNMLELLKLLLSSVPFVLAVLITAIMSSAVAFALYFITQVCAARGYGERETVIAVSTIMLLGPAPGMMAGSWAVGKLAHRTPSHPAGGYTDHVATFQVATFSAAAVLSSALLLPASWTIWGTEGKAPFALACFGWFFSGGMAGPAMNGMAVSVIPRASHFASGVQFAAANTAKIVVPMIGGWTIDQIGLVDGFNVVAVVCPVIFLVLAAIGLMHAKKRGTQQGYERLPEVDGRYSS